MKKALFRLLDRLIYLGVDVLGALSGLIDYLIDCAGSGGHPQATLKVYIQTGRSILGWTYFFNRFARDNPTVPVCIVIPRS